MTIASEQTPYDKPRSVAITVRVRMNAQVQLKHTTDQYDKVAQTIDSRQAVVGIKRVHRTSNDAVHFANPMGDGCWRHTNSWVASDSDGIVL
jgi:hypothetical protein